MDNNEPCIIFCKLQFVCVEGWVDVRGLARLRIEIFGEGYGNEML